MATLLTHVTVRFGISFLHERLLERVLLLTDVIGRETSITCDTQIHIQTCKGDRSGGDGMKNGCLYEEIRFLDDWLAL
jgi:hypothetical protein